MSVEQDTPREGRVSEFKTDPRFAVLGAMATQSEQTRHVLEGAGHTSLDAAEQNLSDLNPVAREVLNDKEQQIAAQAAEIERLTAKNTELLETIESTGIDPDTGALNRVGLNRYLENTYGVRHSEPTYSAPHERRTDIRAQHMLMLLGDVCDLKLVNDNLGHDAGDAMLRRAAEKAKELLRGGDIVARIGGDEFLMLVPLPENASEHEIEAFITTVVDRLRADFSHKREKPIPEIDRGTVVEPVMAIGVAHGLMVDYDTFQKMSEGNEQPSATTYHLLLKEADEAMYAHKAALKASGLTIGRDKPVEETKAKDMSPDDLRALAAQKEKDKLMQETAKVFDLAEHRKRKLENAYAAPLPQPTQGVRLDRVA